MIPDRRALDCIVYVLLLCSLWILFPGNAAGRSIVCGAEVEVGMRASVCGISGVGVSAAPVRRFISHRRRTACLHLVNSCQAVGLTLRRSP